MDPAAEEQIDTPTFAVFEAHFSEGRMMLRLAGSLLAVLLVAGVGQADAEEPHQEWMKFLQGEWTYEYKASGLKGEARYTRAAKQNAVIARGQNVGGGTFVELIGWRADTETMVFTGYASGNNNYWQSEFDVVAVNEMSGHISGISPKGRPDKGAVKIKRVDDDTFEVHLEMGNGKGVGVFNRKTPDSPK